MELLEYEKMKREICNRTHNCGNCGISAICKAGEPLTELSDENIARAVTYVEEYAEKCRSLTNRVAIAILFPNFSDMLCPGFLMSDHTCPNSIKKDCFACKEEFLNAPYTGPLADKLNEWREENEIN